MIGISSQPVLAQYSMAKGQYLSGIRFVRGEKMGYLFLTSVLLPLVGCAAIVAYVAVLDQYGAGD